MACLFCTHLNEHEVVYEDDRVAVRLHDDWAVRGHAMIVWKRHVENIADLDAAEAAHYIRVHHAAERALLALTGAGRAILMKLGIAVPHLHMHIYPVAASMTRAEIFDAIEGRRQDPRDSAFVTALRDALRDYLDSERNRE